MEALGKGLCDFTKAYDDMPKLKQISQHACQTIGGTTQTYLLARHLLSEGIEGDFVECGVAGGAQLACMALAMWREKVKRPIHAFDSFQGIPHAGPNDDQQPGLADFLMDRNAPLAERLRTTGISSCSLDAVKTTWESWLFSRGIDIRWYEGWFQDTVPSNRIYDISFLRLDGDLYESTIVCLDWLYDKVSKGGIVYVDDYGLSGCAKAVHEFIDKLRIKAALLRDDLGNTGAVYWIKA